MTKWFIVTLTFICALAHGQAVLEPPLGLKWGDSPDGLLDWAQEHQMDIGMKMPGDKPSMRVFRIERPGKSLPDSEASAVEARYLGGRLIEVTLHHATNTDNSEAVSAAFNVLKKKLVTEHGPLVANQQKNLVEDDFVTRTISFHREPVRGLFLLLAYTEVEDRLRKKRQATYSLIYRNDNLRQRLEAEGEGGDARRR